MFITGTEEVPVWKYNIQLLSLLILARYRPMLGFKVGLNPTIKFVAVPLWSELTM